MERLPYNPHVTVGQRFAMIRDGIGERINVGLQRIVVTRALRNALAAGHR